MERWRIELQLQSVPHQIKDLPLSIPLKLEPSHPLQHSQKITEQFFHQKFIGELDLLVSPPGNYDEILSLLQL